LHPVELNGQLIRYAYIVIKAIAYNILVSMRHLHAPESNHFDV
jgi:hypothetical protein